MPSDTKQGLKTILHPYLFILKEGSKIKENFLDYSLMMFQINSMEKIKSPADQRYTVEDKIMQVEIKISSLPNIIGKRR